MTAMDGSMDDKQLARAARDLGDLAMQAGKRVVTAESCTGGWIAKALTDIPGSSAWFDGGAVTYSNRLKQDVLGVSAETLAVAGAVSRETAVQMAAGVLRALGGDVAVAVTGIAGPDGGSADKPVGTVWVGHATIDGAQAECFHFDGDREAVRRQTVAVALQALAKMLTS